ncbi:glycoside hydrolase family 3 C-terminal domain-containing protein [uncultured Eubacterium sp.]|uniref:glycoside hydrolase family 3 protein n=1 Tax=uncultured Eubacterium sp. TaxID=165185 RepID=UPI00262E54AB|nr:glycoside hydrolase family 3 protein [uncultured Eubacterium sp.]
MSTNMFGVPVEEFAQKSKEAATEGIVLLKNEGGMLPLTQEDKISVFGRPQIEYYRSGTGSGGAVNVEYATNILDGFENSNLNIDETLVEKYKNWLKDHPFDNGGGGWACEPWFQKDMPIDEAFAKEQAAKTNKALYIIGRTAGEDKDNAIWQGSYILTDEEKENLRNITKAFDNVCIVLNVSNIIDLSWINDEEYNGSIKSVIIVWQGGMEGGTAVVDVLSGAETPSGKLADTIAYSIEDYPSTKNFGNEFKNLYEEDIYIGYRYFETFAPDKVQFEFGYGLSYTTFDIETQTVKEKTDSIELNVKVTNTGDKFAGKEVVQVYYEAPQGELGKPARELIAFAKTKKLAPGESQELTLEFKISDMASYDDSGVTGHKSCYVLESGEYNIYVGNSVKNLTKINTYNEEELVVVEELQEAMAPTEAINIMKPGKKNADGTYEVTYVPVSTQTVDMAKRISDNLPMDMPITGDMGITLQDVRDGKATLEKFVAQLSIEEMAIIIRGEGMSNPRVTRGTASAFGGMSDSLFNYGIPAACCADGPSGLRMEGKATQLPIGTALSATWNTELVRELYTMEGQELYRNQVDTLLGPGVNIRRNPLNGRNFEYFSEDPFLSGKMSVASTGGIKDGGAWGTIKHFALNGQESHRFKIDAVCSERAIREIYLKSFEMAVKEKTVMSIMTSYNPINGHWAASNYDLCTTILRKEWGYKGFVMTDWWAKMNDVVTGGKESNQDTRDMVRAQNDAYMVVNNNGAEINSNGDNTEAAIIEGRLTVGELQRASMNILRFILVAPVIERELIDTNVAEYFESASDAKYEVQKLANDAKIKFEGTDNATVEIDEDAEYTIIVHISSPLPNLSQCTVNVHTNDKVMVVIQTSGTDGKWITQKLCKVKLDKGFYNLELEHVMAGMNVGYIEFKKIPKKKAR